MSSDLLGLTKIWVQPLALGAFDQGPTFMKCESLTCKQIQAHSLLTCFLEELKSLGETPLRQDHFSLDMIRLMLRSLESTSKDLDADWPARIAEMNRLILTALSTDTPSLPSATVEVSDVPAPKCCCEACKDPTISSQQQQPSDDLAIWLDRLSRVLAQTSLEALPILGFRLAGFGDREIAQRTGLGSRLVRLIRTDAGASWRAEVTRC